MGVHTMLRGINREEHKFMTRRTMGFAVAAFALTMFLLTATMALFTSNTQASVPPSGGVSTLPSKGNAPIQPNVSTWADIAAFPAVTYSPTPGAAAPAKLKRAGAAA